MSDRDYIRLALALARRGYGATSPNPMVGAVLVKHGRIIGRGWHRRVGQPHAEIEAIRDAERRGATPRGATLYVTLEPCCTHGRTPPCTEAIIARGVRRVVAGATDPNPRHCGKAFALLRRAGVRVSHGLFAEECACLNEVFNHWIVHRTPLVMVKAAMTLDGKIATATGESKWITGESARAFGMKLRQGADAILVGVNTILADDPSLTFRSTNAGHRASQKKLRRIVLDFQARTPLRAKVVSDPAAVLTTIVVSHAAPENRVKALAQRTRVLVAPLERASSKRSQPVNGTRLRVDPTPARLSLPWLLHKLGSEEVTSLLVEGGGEVNASFLLQGLAHRIAFFYAPKIMGGRDARKTVAGEGAKSWDDILRLDELRWRRLGTDWLLTARCLSQLK